VIMLVRAKKKPTNSSEAIMAEKIDRL
jgi:hypothetical protein